MTMRSKSLASHLHLGTGAQVLCEQKDAQTPMKAGFFRAATLALPVGAALYFRQTIVATAMFVLPHH